MSLHEKCSSIRLTTTDNDPYLNTLVSALAVPSLLSIRGISVTSSTLPTLLPFRTLALLDLVAMWALPLDHYMVIIALRAFIGGRM